jgi:hypothetical protein
MPLVSALQNHSTLLMKTFATCLLAIAAVTLIGACDSHSWDKTKVLHENLHDKGHGDHGAAGDHKTEGAAKDEHHGEKKAH